MTDNDLVSKIEKFVQGQVSELNWFHTKGMLPIGDHLTQKMEAEEKVVHYAILFHDVAKDKEPSSHAAAGAQVCEDFLKNYSLHPEFIARVVHCVEAHAWAWGENVWPRTEEARIVFDADMLQQLGQWGVFKHLASKYGHLDSLTERVEKTKQDLEKAASKVLTPVGKVMASKIQRVYLILDQIMEGN